MKRIGVLMIMAVILPLGIYAQDADANTFTDEELTTYATVMKWAEDEKGVLSSVVKDSVSVWMEGSELTKSQYNVLTKAKKAGTLEEVEATEGELAIFNDIQERIDNKKADFKATFTSKIKEDIGAGLYNRLKKALKADAELKERYTAILDGLSTSTEEESSESN